jgi:hypothetical protein
MLTAKLWNLNAALLLEAIVQELEEKIVGCATADVLSDVD